MTARTTPSTPRLGTLSRLAIGCSLAVCAALPAAAQDFGAMIQHQMNLMNQNIARGNQMVGNMVQQRMQDPQVRAAYQQYVARMRQSGQGAMDFPTYTYNYIYTRGFSADGIAHARATDAGIQANDRAAVQRLRDAQARRGDALQQQRDSYFRNQGEAGLGLMGQSTYSGNGYRGALPHTWQRNSQQNYQGNTYRVDGSGQYHVLGTDGLWYPINR